MPAGTGQQCRECAAQAALSRRLERGGATFITPAMGAHYSEFGLWLSQEIGVQKAAVTVRTYLPFFLELDEKWQGIPSYEALLRHFSAEGLRRVRLPMRWLIRHQGVEADAEKRELDSEERRIHAQLATFPSDSPAAVALHAYHVRLMERVASGRTSTRSVRLALTPAVALLRHTHPSGETLPEQKHLDAYLRHAPGQKAGLTGFVRFLSRETATPLELRVNQSEARETKRRKLEAKVLALLNSPQDDQAFLSRWLAAALPYFHGLPRGVVRKLRAGDVEVVPGDGIKVSYDGKIYWLPQPTPADTGTAER